MAVEPAFLGSGVSVVALIVSIFSLRRSTSREDSAARDVRIDERIRLALGEDIATIKNEMLNISRTLSGNAELVRNTVDATTNAITESARALLKLRD